MGKNRNPRKSKRKSMFNYQKEYKMVIEIFVILWNDKLPK